MVQFTDGRVAVVDEAELDRQFDAGRLSSQLRGKSRAEAYTLRDSLLKEGTATLP